ncbi:MAG: DUF488 domain-containing protein [Hyphomonadaceae bacterium]|nr:DUF488 domain-containing protein [Hyphomonadaceae bacterium]
MAEIWTIGYEHVGQADLIRLLTDAKIAIVLDVRELPNSRRAGFSRRQLQAGLQEAGIAYRHLKLLGTPKAGRDANKRRDWQTFEKIVEGALDRPEAELQLLEAAEIAQAQRACLLCLETDWTHCHRAEIVRRLKAKGAITQAHHLSPVGAAAPGQQSPKARSRKPRTPRS